MGLPQVTITFQTLGTTAIQRGERGIVLLLLKDSAGNGEHTITSTTDIPTTLSEANKTIITDTLIGNDFAPLRVLVKVLANSTENWNDGLTWAETQKFDYLVIPTIATSEITAINTWVANQRAQNKLVKFVSPNNAADKEYIYNTTVQSVTRNDDTPITTAALCARIAGAIAGTPLTKSITYMAFPEIKSVESLTKAQLDTAIDNGEIKLFHDGEKVKLARGVTSFKTTTPTKGAPFKKIKIVETMDMMSNDIRKTIEDSYIGKVSNSYDNKVMLCVAIKGYVAGLEAEGLLAPGTVVEINLAAQKLYLQQKGIDTSKMTDQQIKEANTDDKVFIRIQGSILDAMEDFDLAVGI